MLAQQRLSAVSKGAMERDWAIHSDRSTPADRHLI
jgi:hypothetical protein